MKKIRSETLEREASQKMVRMVTNEVEDDEEERRRPNLRNW